MFNKILIASDGSAESEKALAVARHIAIEDASDVELVHVREYRLGVHSPMERTNHSAEEREAVVRNQARELTSAGVSVELTVTASTPDSLAAALAEHAEGIGADAIVVGADLQPAHGVRGGRTVTQQLVQIAPCPVVVVPLRSHVREGNEAARTAAAHGQRDYR